MYVYMYVCMYSFGKPIRKLVKALGTYAYMIKFYINCWQCEAVTRVQVVYKGH
jgi:hypothetical protein